MTTKPTVTTSTPPGFIVLPDAPMPEDMNNFTALHFPGNTHFLAEHLGNPDTTLIIGEAYISPEPTSQARGLMAPDMLIAFNVNPGISRPRNGYVISDHGKPPDFVLEIASEKPDGGMSRSSGRGTLPWASRNTGALTIPAAGFTGRPSPATNWWRESTGPSALNALGSRLSRATAPSSTCTCAGKTVPWAGTTRPPGGTSPGSATSGNGPMLSGPPVWPPRLESANWKRNWNVARSPDCQRNSSPQ